MQNTLYTITGTVTLKKGAGRSLKAGGMWVYDNEISSMDENVQDGGLVHVLDFDGFFLGTGFINRRSKITVRLLARRKDTVIDDAFWEKRVRDAWGYRKQTVDTGSCRIIFGEADWFPGLVVDKFSDVLVVESLALGIDRFKPLILDILRRCLLRTAFRYAASTNGATPRSASRKAWNASRAFFRTPSIPAYRSRKTA